MYSPKRLLRNYSAFFIFSIHKSCAKIRGALQLLFNRVGLINSRASACLFALGFRQLLITKFFIHRFRSILTTWGRFSRTLHVCLTKLFTISLSLSNSPLLLGAHFLVSTFITHLGGGSRLLSLRFSKLLTTKLLIHRLRGIIYLAGFGFSRTLHISS